MNDDSELLEALDKFDWAPTTRPLASWNVDDFDAYTHYADKDEDS